MVFVTSIAFHYQSDNNQEMVACFFNYQPVLVAQGCKCSSCLATLMDDMLQISLEMVAIKK